MKGFRQTEIVKTGFLLLILFLVFNAGAQQTGNGKKVYVDYHGTRYSREHDGMLGRWSFYGLSGKSETPLKLMCYNGDNILENGKHQIAAVHYPLTGIQSNLDPDFIEYQILSARTAKIDGIFIEWGFPEHESTWLLDAFRKVAAKYHFEIGVNWCDGWLYYDWITKLRPEIKTREEKTAHFITSLQYLTDSVFSTPTAPKVKGVPVYYLFGGGIRSGEYDSVVTKHSFRLPGAAGSPQGLRRVAEWGELVNGRYESPPLDTEFATWERLGMSPTAWIPPRVRRIDAGHPYWDNYATREDVLRSMEPFKAKVWDQPRDSGGSALIRSGFVTPGMDNRGCGGWGRGHFFYISREGGQLYDDLWKYNLASGDNLDMMFIASWSDYTEGHEIEPTVENGYRELQTTLRRAAEFKEESYTEKGIRLPLELFRLRKASRFLSDLDYEQHFENKRLDQIARLISDGAYKEAARRLKKEAKHYKRATKYWVTAKKYSLGATLLINGQQQRSGVVLEAGKKHYITIDEALRKKFAGTYYEGYINFEYLDSGKLNQTVVYSNTTRVKDPVVHTGDFSVVGEIRTANSGQWKKAKIKLIKANIDFLHTYDKAASFKIAGNVPVRNVTMDFTVFEQRNIITGRR
ncbi:glycoside hydrolase family 71/99 protein [Niabella drilacis]|uniref:Uncharacterized protein n=1 Tax=Niabella drilacis (strain DSM 25811 / CCM 8410 / CCUG 62505 / LMG 26954 / E90) TaxID=1285928 RepID=A0A1G6T9U1_NIADE|nr:hypothetical protein [Niabella drilacis]SDD25811.1 hypothetical protein SAMN04487894_107145 [Niabella drilacis]